jgi:hypothetical protein
MVTRWLSSQSILSPAVPTYYVRPWSGEGHLIRTHDRMFEMACHEGNYSLENILGGARQEEANR